MYNFNMHLDTNIHFGKGQIKKLGKDIIKYTDRLLLVYGGGSIKKNGIYDSVVAELKDNNIYFEELSGVDPNPRIESVVEGIKLCKENQLGGILAVGGGSSIDCSKVIAAGVKYDGDPWDLVLDRKKIVDAIPIFTVLTLSATGSEMNANAVISNMTTNQKLGTGMPGITLQKHLYLTLSTLIQYQPSIRQQALQISSVIHLKITLPMLKVATFRPGLLRQS